MILSIKFIKKVLHAKSAQLYFHSVATAELAASIIMSCREFGVEYGVSIREAYLGGLVHDIGKLYIPESILNKAEGLTSREWETIKLHPVWGKVLVEGTRLEFLMPAITQHHEGGACVGYPFGLKNHQINPLGKLIAVADSASALLEDRAYRRSIPDPLLVFSMIKHDVEALLDNRAIKPVEHAIIQYMNICNKRKAKAERLSGRFFQRLIDLESCGARTEEQKSGLRLVICGQTRITT